MQTVPGKKCGNEDRLHKRSHDATGQRVRWDSAGGRAETAEAGREGDDRATHTRPCNETGRGCGGGGRGGEEQEGVTRTK